MGLSVLVNGNYILFNFLLLPLSFLLPILIEPLVSTAFVAPVSVWEHMDQPNRAVKRKHRNMHSINMFIVILETAFM